jgi:hypothetical protein
MRSGGAVFASCGGDATAPVPGTRISTKGVTRTNKELSVSYRITMVSKVIIDIQGILTTSIYVAEPTAVFVASHKLYN